LGTNDAYIDSLNVVQLKQKLEVFVTNIQKSSSKTAILFTTPPDTKYEGNSPKKLKEINKPFALIVPLQTLLNVYFKSLFNENVQIIIPKNRIGFIKNDVWTRGADFDTIILNYKMDLPQDIIYETETVPRAPNMFTCPHCKITVTMRGKAGHIKGKQHLANEQI
jgi:hypothetical protein